MSMIQLSTVVLNDADDPADVLVLSRLSKYRRRPSQDGRVVRVAGGGFRAIGTVGRRDVWELEITKAPLATTDWIEAHVGRVVCVRDDQGRKFFAVYWTADVDELKEPRSGSVRLALELVTWTEAV